MKTAFKTSFCIFLIIIIGACGSFGTESVTVGATESTVVGKLGQPTHRYPLGTEQLLEYAHGPWGQQTFMARIGPDGNLISYEQVLTSEKFATIKVGEATTQDVLHTIGAPSETAYLSLSQLEVWTYPYKEHNVWDSLMHVHFDKNGIVRKMLNGPDPRFDPSDRESHAVGHR